jgi:predicted CoA-binding protein
MPDFCEIPLSNATTDEIRALLRSMHTIAVVGLSDKPDRDSYRVAAYMQQAGYRVIPINPAVDEVLGERSYSSLGDVPEKIDLVDIFRKPEAVPEIVDAAIVVGARAVWMQEGIVHNAAADKARAAGLVVVMDRCVLKEHARTVRAIGVVPPPSA